MNKLTKEQIKDIMNEVEYEWNDKNIKFLQEQFIHWLGCYSDDFKKMAESGKEMAIVPLNIEDGFWCDLFTNVVHTTHKQIEDKLKDLVEKSKVSGGKDE